MGDEGVVAFCAPLEIHHGGLIQSLDFEYKGLGPKGMEAIGRTFLSSKTLIELRLGRNSSIGDEGLISFVHAASLDGRMDIFPTLQRLDLSSCGIGPSGMAHLARIITARNAISSRICLTLDDNPLGESSCHSLSLLLTASCLSSLSVKGCSISDEGLRILCSSISTMKLTGLSSFNLSDNRIGPTGAKYLSEIVGVTSFMMDLKELNLSLNHLGSDGIFLITTALQQQHRTELLMLDLTCTNCGVEGAISALTCKSIGSLVLFNNSLGSAGIAALAPFLVGGHPNIKYLDLGGNMADAGAINEILNSLLQKNDMVENRLSTIIFGGNKTDDVVVDLVSQLALLRPELDIAFDRPGRINTS